MAVHPGGHRGPARHAEPTWVWIDTVAGGNYNPLNIQFQEQSDLKVRLQENAEPIDYFNLYFTDAVIEKISQETNRYAEQYRQTQYANIKPYSIVNELTETTPDEIRTFLGMCILMGLVYKPQIWMYW